MRSLFFIFGAMYWKWFIPLLFVASFFLLGNAKPSAGPNQEIVVELSANAFSEKAADDLLELLTERLEALGVDQLHISEPKPGTFHIQYYSSLAISDVKKTLDQYADDAHPIDFPSSEFPAEKDFLFKYHIVKLQDHTFIERSAQGTMVDIKTLPDPFFNQKVPSLVEFWFKTLRLQKAEAVAVEVYKEPLLKSQIAFFIPEGRAGPRLG